jgi:hypothetical protein
VRHASEQILQASRSTYVEDVIAGSQSAPDRKKDFLVNLVSYDEGIPEHDPLLRLALDPKLLEIISGYFGFWPCVHSVGAWLNYPTGAPAQLSQLWHRDPGDLKVIKVFIYLSDVDAQCGPFTYIPGTHPFGSVNALTKKLDEKKRVSDDLMARVLPSQSWRVCTGPANTMIVADTLGFHRGGKPIAGRRILITFTYTSGTPNLTPTVRVRTMPTWASTIQRFALQLLLTAPSH